jgi:hypothetical protein
MRQRHPKEALRFRPTASLLVYIDNLARFDCVHSDNHVI